MRENYTLTRLYIETRLSLGEDIPLPKEQAHYVSTVLRLKEGEAVRIFNQDDGEWQADIVSSTKRAVTLCPKAMLRAPQKVPDIWLCFAPIRKHRNAFVIEKGTELGVSVFQPVITRRTQFGKINIDKMRAQMIEAAEQTERLCLPGIHESLSLEALLQGWDKNRALIMADEAGGCPPALETLRGLNGPAALLIGPEGGFDPAERERLLGHEFVRPVSLGPRILRADTAALSMLTLWQSVKGDW